MEFVYSQLFRPLHVLGYHCEGIGHVSLMVMHGGLGMQHFDGVDDGTNSKI